MSHITASTDEDVLVIKIDLASLNDFDLSNDVEIEIHEAFQRFNTQNAVIDLQNLKTLDSFEKIIRENSISHFHYTDTLRRMCAHLPDERSQSFGAVLQEVRSDQFAEISFSESDFNAYRMFADEMCGHVTKIENGAKYPDDLANIERRLRDAYQRCMLEETVPDCVLIIRCFIAGTYYYRLQGFPVDAVRNFLKLLRTCTCEQGQILLANLHTRLDTIVRYSQDTDCPADYDVPF